MLFKKRWVKLFNKNQLTTNYADIQQASLD
jgi:hypothetical protein